MAKFNLGKMDIKDILKIFSKKKKSDSVEENNDFFEEKDILEEDSDEESIEEIETELKTAKKKKSFNFKKIGKKQKIIVISSIVAIVLLGGGYYAYMMFSGNNEINKQYQEINNMETNIIAQQPVHHPHRNLINRRRIIEHRRAEYQQHLKSIKKKNNVQTVKTKKQNVRNKSIKTIVKPIPLKTEIKPSKAQQLASIPLQINKKIQQNIISDTLSKKQDPLALINEEIIQSRNYNNYLQQKLQLMQRLIAYFKRKQELEKILSLYEMSYGQNNQRKKEKKQKQEIVNAVSKEIEPLKIKIFELTQKIKELKNKPVREQTANSLQMQQQQEKIKEKEQYKTEFNKITSNFSALQIFMKNGKLIAVLSTPNGDIILHKGDYYKGYRISKILPNMIIFDKNRMKFYYNYASKLNINYHTAEIPLPVTLKEKGLKTKENQGIKVRQYHPINRKELLKKALEERLKNFNQ